MSEYFSSVFAHPVTTAIVAIVATCLVIAPMIFEALRLAGITGQKLRGELYARYLSWLVLVPLIMVPVLAGTFATIVLVAVISLLALREFSMATDFKRHPALVWLVALGIIATGFASFDHWYGLFQAVPAIGMVLIAAVALVPDQPAGYLSRVSIASLCLLLFGTGLGSLGYLANVSNYRPLILSIILCVELNDVFAYVVGRTLGKRKMAPRTSPGKTVAGSLGALVLTTGLFAILARYTFSGTVLSSPLHCIIMGMLVSITGQLGDLVMSSIKRDLGIKDMAQTIPGHGGILDRFDSTLLVAPSLFHYIQYFQGIG